MVANNAFIIKEMEENAEKRGEERAEERVKLDLARNLLDVLDNETIADKTGLDIEVIKKLREENQK